MKKKTIPLEAKKITASLLHTREIVGADVGDDNPHKLTIFVRDERTGEVYDAPFALTASTPIQEGLVRHGMPEDERIEHGNNPPMAFRYILNYAAEEIDNALRRLASEAVFFNRFLAHLSIYGAEEDTAWVGEARDKYEKEFLPMVDEWARDQAAADREKLRSRLRIEIWDKRQRVGRPNGSGKLMDHSEFAAALRDAKATLRAKRRKITRPNVAKVLHISPSTLDRRLKFYGGSLE